MPPKRVIKVSSSFDTRARVEDDSFGNTRGISRLRILGATRVPPDNDPRESAKETAARLRLRERMRASVAEAGQEDDDLVRVRPLVDVRKLAAEGWDAEPVGPDGTAAWKHPYLGYVWTPKAGSPKWFARPHGELFRFGPFASIDDAISALERRGGAA